MKAANKSNKSNTFQSGHQSASIYVESIVFFFLTFANGCRIILIIEIKFWTKTGSNTFSIIHLSLLKKCEYFQKLFLFLNAVQLSSSNSIFSNCVKVLGFSWQFLFLTQAMIVISGNLSFLNHVTMLPSICCFDDKFFSLVFTQGTKVKVIALQKIKETHNMSKFFFRN